MPLPNTQIGSDGVRYPTGTQPTDDPGFPPAGVIENIIEVSDTTYTFVLSDSVGTVRSTAAGAATFTMPPNVDVPFPVEVIIPIRSAGAGGLTIAPGSGVTINGLVIITQYQNIVLHKVATNEWDATGGTA